VILDCDRLWTELVTRYYRLRGIPRVTNDPPPVAPPTRRSPASGDMGSR
jgi:hypothetical protein